MKNGTRVTLEKDDATYWDKWTKSLKLKRKTEDGIVLTPKRGAIRYAADSHAGTMKEPVLLQVEDETRPYKLIENLKTMKKYDVTGKKL